MSEQRRNRNRKNKNEEKRPIILAKRPEEPGSSSSSRSAELQPKILQKPRDVPDTANEAPVTANGEAHVKTLIYTRTDTHSPNLTKPEQADSESQASEPKDGEALMPRPITVILSTGVLNQSAMKFINKTNKDFFVVGVLGQQGVGKSTILNLLANEDTAGDPYRKLFVDQDNIFPTKLKLHKLSARSRTESTHMYFTSDRMVLLDSPPLMCNSYKKDMTTNELDDLRLIITFFTVCHLVVVVQDDYFNVNLMRLLQLAELMKPLPDGKPFSNDYYPNVLFVKNRAKRQDYEGKRKQQMDKTLATIFRDSSLRVYEGQTSSGMQRQPRKPRGHNELEPQINSVMFPDVKGPAETPYHASLHDLIVDFRRLVYRTPRNAMYSGSAEFTEAVWYEMLKAVHGDQHMFFKVYSDTVREHLEGPGGGGGDRSANSKEVYENWRE